MFEAGEGDHSSPASEAILRHDDGGAHIFAHEIELEIYSYTPNLSRMNPHVFKYLWKQFEFIIIHTQFLFRKRAGVTDFPFHFSGPTVGRKTNGHRSLYIATER